jgi:methyltransferase (TIGR00027 family)
VKPISRTAYYCCGVRALDAAAPAAFCGDRYAERFMTPESWAIFEPFRELGPPNASNVVRHRMIDDVLRARLAARPETPVVVLGAGFDTRAYRLPGGRWIEVDEPAVMTLKESRLPAADSSNPLTRCAVEFDREPIGAALTRLGPLDRPVVVLEGVLPYLSVAEARALLRAVGEAFAPATLICDLTTPTFKRRYAGRIAGLLQALGAPYGRFEGDPLAVIESEGFRLVARESIIGTAARLGALRIPRWVLATMFRSLRDGYTIATFETQGRIA